MILSEHPSAARASTTDGRWGGRVTRLAAVEPARARDLVVVGALLALVAATAFGSHVRDGSFYYDDWANSARTQLAGGYGNALDAFWELTGYRPVLAVFVPTLHAVLGESSGLHLAWASFMAVLMSTAFYAVLAELGVARVHSFVISALVLVFPFSDATRMWATSATAHLTGALWLGGLWLTLRAFDVRRSRRSATALHGASLVLYLTSILLYELPATLMLAGGALYLLRTGWRRGVMRWSADLAVILPALGYIVTNTKIDTASNDVGPIEHLGLILDQGWEVMASAAWPFGAVDRSVLTAIAAAVIGLAGWMVMRTRVDPIRGALRLWLSVAAGGFVATWTAWAVFIPSDPYYSPGSLGVGNRVNALAALGIVVFLYALVVLATTLLFGVRRRAHPLAPLVACAAVALGLGSGYLALVADDKAAWGRAGRAQSETLAVLRSSLPAPPPESVIWTFGQPAWQAPGIPVFASTWDLNGAVQLLYDEPTLRSYPALPLTTFECGPMGMVPQTGSPGPLFDYGTLYFVDVGSRQVDVLTDPDDCRAAAVRFQPGPFELPGS